MERHNLLFTGGFDSTFRLCQLSRMDKPLDFFKMIILQDVVGAIAGGATNYMAPRIENLKKNSSLNYLCWYLYRICSVHFPYYSFLGTDCCCFFTYFYCPYVRSWYYWRYFDGLCHYLVCYWHSD